MATQYFLIAEIRASKDILEKIRTWAGGAEQQPDEAEKARIEALLNGADWEFMGVLPAALDPACTEKVTDRLSWRSFCDGARFDSEDKSRLLLAFRAPDPNAELWDFLSEKHPEIESIRVYADPDYEDDVEELGEEDLYAYVHR